MSDDLVQRLRKDANNWTPIAPYGRDSVALEREAADRIEALEAELADAKRERDYYHRQLVTKSD